MPRSISESAYEVIRDEIISNKVRAGERINDRELAARLGVSRTPIREALLRLGREGFVVTVPRQGTYVKTLSQDEIREIYIIREALEAAAARIAAQIIDEDSLAQLGRYARVFEQAIKARDYSECTRIDVAFHNLIVKSSNLRRLYETCKRMHLQTVSISVPTPYYAEKLPKYAREHHQILEAFENHDGDLAEAVVRSHIRGGRKDLLASADEVSSNSLE